MKFLTHLLRISVSSALLAAAATAAERVFDVTGVIRGSLDDGQLIIQHDEIPGYMPAMTMAFAIKDPADATRLQHGDRVRFKFRVTDDQSRADGFVVTGRDSTTPKPQTAAPSKVARLREGDTVSDFTLLDQDNAPLTPAALRDRLTVMTFIFTRCPVPEFCPAMAMRFGQLQKAILADPKLAPRARLLSITLDPEFDRPEILKAYGDAVGANFSVWNFATGTTEQIATLTKAFAVYTERNGVTLDHTLCTALIDGRGRIVELWRGNGWKIDEVLAALSRPGGGADY